MTETFEIESIKGELLVSYSEVIIKNEPNIEECHGTHVINNDDVIITLLSVEVVICGIGIDILPRLTKKQKNNIIQSIEEKQKNNIIENL